MILRRLSRLFARPLTAVALGLSMVSGTVSAVGLTAEDIANNMVAIPGQPFKVSKFEVTRAQYEAFVKATNYNVAGCRIWDGTILIDNPSGNWSNTGFPQEPDHPAVCLSWEDAEDYLKWLNDTVKPAKPYRLPTTQEWIIAAKAGIDAPFPWGSELFDRGLANCVENVCADGHKFTAVVGSLPPNKFGLFDMGGNVWEWTSSCNIDGNCKRRMIHGGSWLSNVEEQLRTDFKWGNDLTMRSANIGLRLFQDN